VQQQLVDLVAFALKSFFDEPETGGASTSSGSPRVSVEKAIVFLVFLVAMIAWSAASSLSSVTLIPSPLSPP